MIFYIKWELKVQIDWYDLEVLMNHMKYKLKTKKKKLPHNKENYQLSKE